MSRAVDEQATDLVARLSLPTIAVGLRDDATPDQRRLAFAAAGRAIAALAGIRARLGDATPNRPAGVS